MALPRFLRFLRKPRPSPSSRPDPAAATSPSEDPRPTCFACNICLCTAKDPVVTDCGHLFCWPCLYRWVDSPSPGRGSCPVCKTAVRVVGPGEATVTPIFGHGAGSPDRVRAAGEDLPPRPSSRKRDQPQAGSGVIKTIELSRVLVEELLRELQDYQDLFPGVDRRNLSPATGMELDSVGQRWY